MTSLRSCPFLFLTWLLLCTFQMFLIKCTFSPKCFPWKHCPLTMESLKAAFMKNKGMEGGWEDDRRQDAGWSLTVWKRFERRWHDHWKPVGWSREVHLHRGKISKIPKISCVVLVRMAIPFFFFPLGWSKKQSFCTNFMPPSPSMLAVTCTDRILHSHI